MQYLQHLLQQQGQRHLTCMQQLLQWQQQLLHPPLPNRQLAVKQQAAAAHQHQQSSWVCLQRCWLLCNQSWLRQIVQAGTASVLEHGLLWKHMMLARGHLAAVLCKVLAHQQQQGKQQLAMWQLVCCPTPQGPLKKIATA
jgi:hypothetical protein